MLHFPGHILKAKGGKKVVEHDYIDDAIIDAMTTNFIGVCDPYANIIIWAPQFQGDIRGVNRNKFDAKACWRRNFESMLQLFFRIRWWVNILSDSASGGTVSPERLHRCQASSQERSSVQGFQSHWDV
jgi:hypothetical protein